MLRSFRFSNHRSIKDESELVLLPAYKSDRPVVPVTALFGPNASGKSNVLHALSWMWSAVSDSYGQWRPDGGVPRDPYLLSPSGRAEPSVYSVDFVADGVRHFYGFAVDDARVREEWLHTYPKANRRRVVFEREGESWRFGSTVPRARFAVLQELTRDNALFLSVAIQSGAPETAAAGRWFRRAWFSWPVSRVRARVNDTVEYLSAAPANREGLVALLKAADLGISDVRPIPVDSSDGLVLEKPDLEFVHGANGAALRSWQQSRGTLEWLGLLVPALTALEHGGLLVVDELDASLHPVLTPQLIELFKDERSNPHHAQLLFTGHDATLLDEDTLRRDEIWFTEKNLGDGVTRLYPLSDFHPRKNENTEGRYLTGSYGAVPTVSGYEFRDALRRLRAGEPA